MSETETIARTKAVRGAPARKPVREARIDVDERDDGFEDAPAPKRKPGAMEFKHPLTGEIITRDAVTIDRSPFDIPRYLWPEGMIYEWKRESVYGQKDEANILSLRRNGWKEVPADRHPDRSVAMEGLVLMECPEVFVQAAREQEARTARGELHQKAQPLPLPGGFDEQHSSAQRVSFTRRGERVATPDSLKPQRSYTLDE